MPPLVGDHDAAVEVDHGAAVEIDDADGEVAAMPHTPRYEPSWYYEELGMELVSQCLRPRADREPWSINVDGFRPSPGFVITQVVLPGGLCPVTGTTYSRNHHGIVFCRPAEPVKAPSTISKKNAPVFRGPMDKFVTRVK